MKTKKRLLTTSITLIAAAGTSSSNVQSSSFDGYGAFTLYLKPLLNSGTAQNLTVKVIPTLNSFGDLPEETLGTISASDVTNGVVNKFISDDVSVGSYDTLKVKLEGASGTYNVTVAINLIGMPL